MFHIKRHSLCIKKTISKFIFAQRLHSVVTFKILRNAKRYITPMAHPSHRTLHKVLLKAQQPSLIILIVTRTAAPANINKDVTYTMLTAKVKCKWATSMYRHSLLWHTSWGGGCLNIMSIPGSGIRIQKLIC